MAGWRNGGMERLRDRGREGREMERLRERGRERRRD